jgi:hypothetical protein
MAGAGDPTPDPARTPPSGSPNTFLGRSSPGHCGSSTISPPTSSPSTDAGSPTGTTPPPGHGKTCAHTRAVPRRLLEPHLADNKPLPGNGSKVNMFAIAKLLDCDRRSLYGYHEEIKAVAAIVGVTRQTFFDATITGFDDGIAWVPGIATHHRSPEGLATLARLLQTACYVVIAFLSGMSDSEKRAELRLMQHSATKTMR